MSKGKRYTEEFKIEAAKQVTERGYSVQDIGGIGFHLLIGILKPTM